LPIADGIQALQKGVIFILSNELPHPVCLSPANRSAWGRRRFDATHDLVEIHVARHVGVSTSAISEALKVADK